MRFLKSPEESPYPYMDTSDAEETKRLLELCESLDAFRMLDFAGNSVGEDTVFNVPLTQKDMALLFFAVDDYIGTKLAELNHYLKQGEKVKK